MNPNSNNISDQAVAHDGPSNVNFCQQNSTMVNSYPPNLLTPHPKLDLFLDGSAALSSLGVLAPGIIKSRSAWNPPGQDQTRLITFSDRLGRYSFPQQMDPALSIALPAHIAIAENTTMSSSAKAYEKTAEASGRIINGKHGSQLEPDEPSAAPVKQRRSKENKAQPSAVADAKRDKYLQRNRIAATKCRLKRHEWMKGLVEKKLAMESENTTLKLQWIQAQDEVTNIKKLIMAHAYCNEPAFLNWIENEAICLANSPRPTFEPLSQSAVIDEPCPNSGGSSIRSTQESVDSRHGCIVSSSQPSSRMFSSDYGKPASANHSKLQSRVELDVNDMESLIEAGQESEGEDEGFAPSLAGFACDNVC